MTVHQAGVTWHLNLRVLLKCVGPFWKPYETMAMLLGTIDVIQDPS